MNLKELNYGTTVKVGSDIKVVKSIEYDWIYNTYHVVFTDGFNDNYYINGSQEYPTCPHKQIKENV